MYVALVSEVHCSAGNSTSTEKNAYIIASWHTRKNNIACGVASVTIVQSMRNQGAWWHPYLKLQCSGRLAKVPFSSPVHLEKLTSTWGFVVKFWSICRNKRLPVRAPRKYNLSIRSSHLGCCVVSISSLRRPLLQYNAVQLSESDFGRPMALASPNSPTIARPLAMVSCQLLKSVSSCLEAQ